VESLLSKSQEQQGRLQENENEREALSDDKEDLEDQLEAANLVSFARLGITFSSMRAVLDACPTLAFVRNYAKPKLSSRK
jgi:hypothetical protein